MKINARIILITFLVVVIVSVTSSIIYYSVTNAILESRNSKNILNSANDFVFLLESSIDKASEDFQKYYLNSEDYSRINIDSTDVDVMFTIGENNNINFIVQKSSVFINQRFTNIQSFIDDNPFMILKHGRNSLDQTLFFGIIINENFLNSAAEKIRSDVALIIDNIPYVISNSTETDKFFSNLVSSQNELRFRNNFDISITDTERADFLAVKYEPKFILSSQIKFGFLIFSYFTEIYDFTDTMKIMLPIILFTGILLTMIFTLLFTSKFRKQISLLTSAADITGKGNFDYRVPIISKDEIGELGITFNKMMSEISNKEKIEKEYSEFITIINQNITLKTLSKAVLHKILDSTKLKFGSIYLFQNNSFRTLASIGLADEGGDSIEKKRIYQNVIDNKEIIEMSFEKNFPVVRSLLVEIQIRYLLIVPIVSGNEIIGLIELASETLPVESPREILNRFIHQFAIGLRNAVSYEKLSNLVDELKQLNEDYQNQNIQIKGKNEELLRLHKELQTKAEELEEERRKAVELTYVKSQFLASMSHELKTPLNSIIGLSELTEKDSTALQKTKDRVKIVLRNSKKLLSMINNILEFSKIESGKYELSEQNFLLSELLSDIYTSSEILSSEKQLLLSVKLNYTKNLLIKTDRSKLEHILLNLLSNAVKFTDKGTVSLSVEKVEEKSLLFKVSDTGIGISEENQTVIFDEFKQLQMGNNRKYSGAGLGLAICNRYAKLLRGKLAVQSKEGLGATFSLFLSNVVVDEVDFIIKDQFEMKSQKYGGSHFVKLDTGTRRVNVEEINEQELPKILIVDDDNDTLYTVGEVLHGLGYDLYYATNGVECLKQLENMEPDLILLDIMMPEMDGFETINKIRTNSLWKNILVFALTAHAMLDDKYIIEGSGFDDLITKPLDSISLQIKVKQAIINNQKNKL